MHEIKVKTDFQNRFIGILLYIVKISFIGMLLNIVKIYFMDFNN